MTATPAPTITEADPVGVAEIVERLALGRHTFNQRRHRQGPDTPAEKRLPEPRWTVGKGPAWDWTLDIVPWARAWGHSVGTPNPQEPTP